MTTVRFTVTKTADGDPLAGESTTDGPNYGSTTSDGDVPQVRIVESEAKDGDNRTNKESENLMDVEEGHRHMALYEEDLKNRPMMSGLLSSFANYEGGMQQNVTQTEGVAGEEVEKPKKDDARLGTVLGVYFPCIQNIFGVILFIRMVWIVGAAGILEAFSVVGLCCLCTLLTSFSMSAIATNGVIPGGGSYFMISRALGPEFGGAVGILFYLATSVASSMYIVGAVEILLNYMAPPLVLIGSINNQADAFNNYRIYGSILLFIMGVWVFLGVKFVSKFSPIALACVILSILSIYIGIFVANPSRGPTICLVGGHIVTERAQQWEVGGPKWCNNSEYGPLYAQFCGNRTINQYAEQSDSCDFFQQTTIQELPGIPGLASGVAGKNLFNEYTKQGDLVGLPGEKGDTEKGEVVADITTTWLILIGIFFPSCTGIMAGSNRSGDLKDAQKSIPTGTIAAILTTSFVYLSTVIFFGATIEGQLLRDKFGESLNGGLVVAELAWPHPWVILIGSFLSTIGAGLQSLTGAPRLLQAISADGVIPFLRVFSVTSKSGEPLRALLLTYFISQIGVLIASLDYIAPIITMFFLTCYGFVNLACALQTLLKTPNWRPRFKFYHWILSLLGVALCITLMFITSWIYSLVTFVLAAAIYKYIEYKGAEKEWGDGIRGLAMSAARYALLRLEEGPPHVKNWRPQLLILLKLKDDTLDPKYRKMLTFSSQLKAGKGLTLISSVLEGSISDRYADATAAHHTICSLIKKKKVPTATLR